jgi:hypothetical protein
MSWIVVSPFACVRPLPVEIGSPTGSNSYSLEKQVITIAVKGPVPVDVEMTPELEVLMELDGKPSDIFAARRILTAGIAQALNIPSSFVRFLNVTAGSLEGSSFALFHIQPPAFSCNISEASALSYCAGPSRLLAVYALPIPLMTPDRISQLDVVLRRLQQSATDGTLQSFLPFYIIRTDVTAPPPIATATGGPVVQPVILLRSGVFGFRETEVFANETDGEVTVWVDRIGSGFGVAVVQFSTADSNAKASEGAYRTVAGVLQFLPYVTSLVTPHLRCPVLCNGVIS